MKAVRILFICFSISTLAQQPQGSSTSTAKPTVNAKTTAAISGAVIQGESQPIRKVKVTLFSDVPGEPGTESETDSDGHFAFKDLAAGRYRLIAQRAGYVSPRRSAVSQSIPVTVKEGQQIEDFTIKLVPGAIVKGIVTDEDGEPVQRAMVQALQQQFVRGRRRPMPVGSSMTNDLGEFRVSGLIPGSYFLVAGPPMRMMMPTTLAPKSNTRQDLRTYYPGALDLDKAVQLQVRSGDEMPVNITLLKQETVPVKGTVFLANGEKAQNGSLFISPAGDPTPFGQTTTMVHDGVFEARVAPGQYRLTAMVSESGQVGQMSMSSETIVVPREGVDNVQLRSGRGAKVTTKLRVEGAQDVDYEKLRLTLARRFEDDADIGSFMLNGMNVGKTNKDGVVEMDHVVPGNYDVIWSYQGRGLEDFYLKSIVLGSRDVTAEGARVTSDPLQLQVVISASAPRIEGSVTQPPSEPVKRMFIVAVPDGDRRKRDNTWKFSSSDQYGHFLLRGLIPGRYTLLALEDPDPGIWMDPEFLKKVEDQGTSLSVKENDRQQVQLRLIPASETTVSIQ